MEATPMTNKEQAVSIADGLRGLLDLIEKCRDLGIKPSDVLGYKPTIIHTTPEDIEKLQSAVARGRA
jgi:hypothetical protein